MADPESVGSRGPRLTTHLVVTPLAAMRRHHLALLLWLADATTWVLAILASTYLHFDFALVVASPARLTALLVLVAVTQLVVGARLGLYTGRWRRGSFEEATAVVVTVALTAVAATSTDAVLGRPTPLSAAISAAPLALLSIAGLRFLLRLRAEPHLKAPAPDSSRVIVFGAGDGGASVIMAMRHADGSPFVPVALLDDDPAKRRLRIYGVPVRGNRSAVIEVARETCADMLLVAIPSADAELIRDLADRAADAGLLLRVLPPVSELFDGVINVDDIRPASYADLLGRHEVHIDIESIAGYLTDKRVLVTGAGGSIGSELCRQLHQFAPAALVMLDRDESALHAVQLSIEGRALLDSRDLVVADIRDRQRLTAVFAEHRPQVVFHAAALKHLPLLEMHPDEAIKTNVWGTWNVLEAAAGVGVERFVNISTDKAADPSSMLGYSKRIAERLTSWFSSRIDGSCLSVRFGNVLGSRGSVLTTFEAQIALGGPVTVTDPDVTRFFMTVEEAVRLMIQAGAVGGNGDALVLDMGEPVRIADLARRLVDDSGKNIEIQFSGLRPGEKLHEALLAVGEPDHRPVHELISHVPVPALAPADIRALDVRGSGRAIVAQCQNVLASEPPRIGEQRVQGDRSRLVLPDTSRPEKTRRRASDPISPR